jgi:Sulfotransferase domain
MMQMLKAGGVELLTDNIRQPDVNNLRGYFEYEKVKSLSKDNSWLSEAENKAVKIIIQLVPYLPLSFNYSVIIMKRDINEILLSQEKMIENLAGKKSAVGNNTLKKVFENQIKQNEEYLSVNTNFRTTFVNYNELILDSQKIIEELNTFLGGKLDLENTGSVIENSLYRNRIN